MSYLDDVQRLDGAPLPRFADLAALEAAVRTEITYYAYPREVWTRPPAVAGDAEQVDVLIVGAGQSGLITAFRLLRDGIGDVLVVDSAPEGREGPWITWARMETLRTSKDLYGTEQGIRTASFRVWFDTVHGPGAFDAIELIDRSEWMDYLTWLRKATGVVVRNETTVTRLEARGPHWDATLVSADGTTRTVRARKVVAATGMDSLGGGSMPGVLRGLDPARAVHSSADIDLDSLRGKRIAVVGMGASAFDNAGAALEAGAASVVQLARRDGLPDGAGGFYFGKVGLLRGYSSLPDEVRVAFAREEFTGPTPPPDHSVRRCARHENYTLEFGVALDRAEATETGVLLGDRDREWEVDLVIAATGFRAEITASPLLAPFADDILRWGDVVELGESSADRVIAAHPYLGRGMAVRGRTEESSEALRNLHLYSPAAFVSYGIAAHGLNGLVWSVAAITEQIIEDLAEEDAHRLLAEFTASE